MRKERKLDHFARRYGEGELTLGRAAEEAGVSLWRMMDHVRRRKITTQYDLEDLGRDLTTVRDTGSSQ
jgi:predicted HTH domain antitoxin